MRIQVSMSQSKRKETLSVVAVLKTVGFFVILFMSGYLFSGLIYTRVSKDPNFEKDYRQITFGELGNYQYYAPLPNEPVNQEKLEKNTIPDSIKALNGQKVTLQGFMLPADVDPDGRASQFALNGNYDMCFYGVPTKINDWVMVEMPPNVKAPFSHDPLQVFGTLEVGEEMKEGQLVSLYRMKADAVDTGRYLVK